MDVSGEAKVMLAVSAVTAIRVAATSGTMNDNRRVSHLPEEKQVRHEFRLHVKTAVFFA